MKLITLILTLTWMSMNQNIFAQQANNGKIVSFSTFTLPFSLVKNNSQYLQHSMDVVLSDANFELTIGQIKKYKQSINLTIVIIEIDKHFYGEVRVFDQTQNKYVGIVPLEFAEQSESIEKIRFAVTEALLGKKYIMEHFKEIKEKAKTVYNTKSSMNKVNISTPATTLLSEKFKKEISLANIVHASPPTLKAEKTQSLDKNQEIPTKNAGSLITESLEEKSTAPSLKEKSPQIETSSTKEDLAPEIATKLMFDVFAFGGQLEITTEKIIKIITRISHVGFGARIRQIQLNVPRPWLYKAELQIAKPLKKDEFSIPMWRKIELSAYKKNINSYLNLGGGVEAEPLYFISLPSYGQGLTVIDNTIYWLSVGAELKLPTYDKYLLGTKLSKSLYTISNTETKLSGIKINLITHVQINNTYDFDLNFQRSFLEDNGSTANNQIISGFIRYNF